MKRGGRMGLWAAALALAAVGAGGCGPFNNATSSKCDSELADVSMTALAGPVQNDGSATIYGTVQFSDLEAGVELTVRAVYVAGQAVAPGLNDFNFRSWSVTLPSSVLAAYASGSGRAAVPVVAYLYGGCIAKLPVAAEPVVIVANVDGGVDASADASVPGDAAMDTQNATDSRPMDGGAD